LGLYPCHARYVFPPSVAKLLAMEQRPPPGFPDCSSTNGCFSSRAFPYPEKALVLIFPSQSGRWSAPCVRGPPFFFFDFPFISSEVATLNLLRFAHCPDNPGSLVSARSRLTMDPSHGLSFSGFLPDDECFFFFPCSPPAASLPKFSLLIQ